MGTPPQRFGSYVLVEPLGEGAMGDVYLAIAGLRGFETLAVVKRVLPNLLQDPVFVERFWREAEICRRVRHPNLAITHQVGAVNNEPFVAQEFIEGHDLIDLLARLGTAQRHMPVPAACFIAVQVGRALEYLHGLDGTGVVHRDVSPSNIRITFDGQVKLLDLGLAKAAASLALTSTNGAWGKAAYMAPERLQGQTAGPPADIYSLGVVFWECLTGRSLAGQRDHVPPYKGYEKQGQSGGLPVGDISPPSRWNPAVPPALDVAVLRALMPSPQDRFDDARTFIQAVTAVIPEHATADAGLAQLMTGYFNPDAERNHRNQLIADARDMLPATREVDSAKEISPKAPPRHSWRAWSIAAGMAIMATALGVRLLWPDQNQHLRAPTGHDQGVLSDQHDQNEPADEDGDTATMGSQPIAETKFEAAPSQATVKGQQKNVPQHHSQVNHRPNAQDPEAPTSIPPAPQSNKPTTMDHDHAMAVLQTAQDAFNRDDFDRALILSKHAAQYLGTVEAFALLGATHFKKGQYRQASAAYQEAASRQPDNPIWREHLELIRELLASP